MNPKNSKIDETRKFYDLKNEIFAELGSLENSIYEQNSKLDDLDRKIEKLYTVALELKNDYFVLRIQTIRNLYRKLRTRKGYRQVEFDRLFRLCQKLQESNSVDFFNEAIQKRIQKISANYHAQKLNQKPSLEDLRENKYLVYTFQKMYFLVKSLPKRILHNVPYSRKRIRLLEETLDLFPFVPFENTPQGVSKVMILRHGIDFKPLRFDAIQSEIELFPEEIQKKAKVLSGIGGGIKKFYKWKGNNCYFIEFPEVV